MEKYKKDIIRKEVKERMSPYLGEYDSIYLTDKLVNSKERRLPPDALYFTLSRFSSEEEQGQKEIIDKWIADLEEVLIKFGYVYHSSLKRSFVRMRDLGKYKTYEWAYKCNRSTYLACFVQDNTTTIKKPSTFKTIYDSKEGYWYILGLEQPFISEEEALEFWRDNYE